MPLQPPDLDDLTFTRLKSLLRGQIPVYAPEWTDHNESDPGIALLDLFAYMGDQLGYRLNRVPDRHYVALLDLLGLALDPAVPATARVAFYLDNPATVPGRYVVPAGATLSNDAVTLYTDAAVEGVPAQVGAIATTKSADIRKLDLGDTPLDPDEDGDAWAAERFALAWNGKTPAIKDMAGQPVPVGATDHTHLWLGLVFNPTLPAGFVGTRVTLTLQLDDDEQPDVAAAAQCGVAGAEPPGTGATWWYYRPKQPGQSRGTWQALRVLDDGTLGLARSGGLRFEVPSDIGPIPDGEWVDVRDDAPLTFEQICAAATDDPTAVPPEPVPHPILGQIPTTVPGLSTQVPISGWIAARFPGTMPSFSVRGLSFAAGTATAAAWAREESLGTSPGRPGMTVTLAHGDVRPGSLDLAIEEPDGLYHTWEEVPDLDAAGPLDRWFVLDPASGTLRFGDGRRGRVPPLSARMFARSYRWGGGETGPVPAGAITAGSGWPGFVSAGTNLVAVGGGRAGETLDQLKARAPRTMRAMERAVTVSDFETLALRTEAVRVGRAHAIAVRRPLPSSDGPGLDVATEAAGAMSVVIIPYGTDNLLRPTAGELSAVCRYLDGYRLVTTEVHAVPPMYATLDQLTVQVVAKPGWTQPDLRDAIESAFVAWLHPLTGGDDGTGWPFGSPLEHAMLVAKLFQVTGISRVRACSARVRAFRTLPDGSSERVGRRDRTEVKLVDCPAGTGQTAKVELQDDEIVWFDGDSIVVTVVT